MTDFHSAAVRFGRPGKLLVAAIGTTEPTTTTEIWPAGWTALGYTDEGSAFNYEISSDEVKVAEELDILASVTTGRKASVEVALAEMTYRNLNIAFNGGIIAGGGVAWNFEPPDLGDETRVMLGWDAYNGPVTAGTPATLPQNDLRFIFRQVLQGGTVKIENRKGATKQTISVTFNCEKPATGQKLLKIMGASVLNPV